MTVMPRLLELLADKLDVPPERISGDATLRSLAADSLTIVEVVIGVETEFAVELPEVALGDLTVLQIAERVEADAGAEPS